MKYVLAIYFLAFLFCLALLAGCAPQKGDRGDTGPIGIPGDSIVGPPGQDATPTTIVTLCPGVTIYPGVFVEVAICLQGKLYGVYSANGGFLTELVPGTYSSNAIGSACNLTIGSNCVVSH